jgi:serine/threonine protein kinase
MNLRTGSEPSPGVELSGSVRLIEKLGEGGMGSVWTAQHLALKTQVAVKFLISHMAQDAAAATRFQREAMAAARIKSPHVVQIFDHGMSDFGPFIVMELLEGETLSRFVQRHGRLTASFTAQVVSQLCRALSKAHAQGIVHRDIKPDNVFLIDPEREVFVKVLDFGIAKNLRDELSVTSTGAMMGTPHYMSPEQMLSSKHVDLRADLWASAVLAYHCVTGLVPFDGETFGAVAIAVTQGEFAAPHARYGAGSPALDAWFARALARDVSQRFQSAEELADSFARAVNGWHHPASVTGSGQAVPAATLDTSPGRAAPTFTGLTNTNGVAASANGSRRTALAAAASLALVGTLTALAFALFKGHEAPTPPVAGTITTAAVEPPTASSSAASPEASALPPAAPPTVVSAPAPSTLPTATHRRVKPPPPPPPKTPPVTPPPPSHPDRGF